MPDALVANVLHMRHDNAGHMAVQKTIRLIQCEYFWLDMSDDVKNYCKSCLLCAVARPPPVNIQAPLTLTSQPTEAWQEISIDLKGPFGTKPMSRGSCYVMVMIDLLTCAVELVPIPDKSAPTVIPASILTNCGCEFDNKDLGALPLELGIDKNAYLQFKQTVRWEKCYANWRTMWESIGTWNYHISVFIT